jgi:hypothetical protein
VQLVEHRRKPVGLADLLMHHAVINDGILLQQDGSLVAGWTYRGPDMMSSPPAEMEALSARLNSVLKLGSGLDAPMRRNSRRSAWVLTAFGLTEGQINGSTYTLFHDKMPLENLSETIGRSLLKVSSGDTSGLANAIEVFGPVATVIPYRDKQEAFSIAERGGGSLAASVFSADSEFLAGAALELGPSHGRVLLVDPPVGDSQWTRHRPAFVHSRGAWSRRWRRRTRGIKGTVVLPSEGCGSGLRIEPTDHHRPHRESGSRGLLNLKVRLRRNASGQAINWCG